MKNNKGFTLIELLVVIAIIGVLSTVVLASLTTARTRGRDASVQSQLSNMRSQAELYFASNGTNYGSYYGKNTCVTTGSNIFGSSLTGNLKGMVNALINTVTAANTGCAVGNSSETSGTGSSWSVSAVSPYDSTKTYCVDSTGVSKTYPASVAINAITQDATSARCL